MTISPPLADAVSVAAWPTHSLRVSLLTGAIAAVLLAACADMSGITAQAKLRDPQTLGLHTSIDTAAKLAVSSDWWSEFGDEQLNALITQALTDSPTLRVAESRLQKAWAQAGVAESIRLPQINGSLDITRERLTEHGQYPVPLAGSVVTLNNAQISAGWSLDLFGKQRAALDAAVGAARATEADAQTARTLLATKVAQTYFHLLQLDAQRQLAERTLAQRNDMLQLVRDRVNAGLDTTLELRQSEGGLPEARQQLEALREQAQLARNSLGVLVGNPHAVTALKLPMLDAVKPLQLPETLPANLLGQRADLVAARWRVEAAQKGIEHSRAAFYPDVNLVAFVGLNSIGLDNFLRAGSRQLGVGPAVSLPIFEGGRLRAELRGATADYDIAVETYNGILLNAVRETADQIASLQAIARQQKEQRDAQAAAEGAFDIARQRYQAGLGTYLNVLAAESNVLRQRAQAVDLKARALDSQAALARAVGGGYHANELPTASGETALTAHAAAAAANAQ